MLTFYDIFGIPASYIPFLGLGVALAAVMFVLWFLVLKQRFESPLPNEQDEGIWRIPLPQLGRITDGRVSTARNTIASWYARLIQNAPKDEQELYIKARDSALENYWFAQKTGDGKYLFGFVGNPLDPSFHIRSDKPQRFGQDTPVRFVHSVQDCFSRGKKAGFEVVGVKLTKNTVSFTPEQRKRMELDLDGVKNVEIAGVNLERIKHYKELAESRDELNKKTLEEMRKISTERDNAYTALSQKNLGTPETPELRGGLWKAISQKFFTWKQLAATGLAFFIVPNMLIYAGVKIPDPNTMGFAAAVVTFILFPFIEGWLKH